MRIRNGLKGLVYRLSYVCQFIDHGISTAHCNSPPSDTVNLLLVIGVSRTSLIVGGFRYYQRRKLIPQRSVVLVIGYLPSKLVFFPSNHESWARSDGGTGVAPGAACENHNGITSRQWYCPSRLFDRQ